MATLPFALAGAGSVISGLLNGIFGNKAATEEAAGAINAANNANSILFNNNQLTRSDLAPYTGTGQAAITTLGNLLGIGPKPGTVTASTGPAALPKDIQDKQSLLQFLQDWMAGKNPVGADGKHIGSAPHNAATAAKINGQIQQLQQDITTAQEQAQNTTNQNNLLAGQNPDDYGKLLKDFSTSDFTADPGYQFRLSEGQKALERSAAARGGVQSGGTLKDLTDYNQNFASNEFNNAYNRFQTNKVTDANLLLGAAGLGQVSLGQQENLGQNTASQVANNTSNAISDAANAQAAGTINGTNAATSTINGLLNLYNLYQQNGGTSVYGTRTLPGGGTYNGAIDMSGLGTTAPYSGDIIPGVRQGNPVLIPRVRVN